MILGIQCSSEFSSLNLAKRTCPLGLLSLLPNEPDREGWVFNEEVSGDCLSAIPDLVESADLVFLSVHCGNVRRSLRLGHEMYVKGKTVWVGGPEVSMIGPRLLKDHPYLHGLVVGAGDSKVSALFTQQSDLPNNVFLRGSTTDCEPLTYSCPETSLDFQHMKVDYGRLYDLKRHEGVSYLWGNDCSQAKNRCFFCGRLSLGVGYRPAQCVWDELLYVYRQGIRFFYNTTDSVTTNIPAFRQFCNTKPAEMKEDTHRVFVNASGVDEKLVCALRRLNGVAVVGVESFGRMNATGKARTGVQDNLRAIRILAENGVHMVLSFVLGLPGENSETLAETEQGIIDLVQSYGHMIDSIHLSPLLVTTGSPAWRKLMALPVMYNKYSAREVPFDVIEVTNDYFGIFCNVTREYCIEWIFDLCSVIRSISPWIRVGAKGILKSEEAGFGDQTHTSEAITLPDRNEPHLSQKSAMGIMEIPKHALSLYDRG